MKLDAETRPALKRAVNVALRAKLGIGGVVEFTPGICLVCESPFTKNPKAAKQFYCSRQCNKAAQRQRERGKAGAIIVDGTVTGTCSAGDCDADIVVGKYSGEKRFCSKRCGRRDWMRRNGRMKAVDSTTCRSNAAQQTETRAGSGETPVTATPALTPKARPSHRASPSAAASYASTA